MDSSSNSKPSGSSHEQYSAESEYEDNLKSDEVSSLRDSSKCAAASSTPSEFQAATICQTVHHQRVHVLKSARSSETSNNSTANLFKKPRLVKPLASQGVTTFANRTISPSSASMQSRLEQINRRLKIQSCLETFAHCFSCQNVNCTRQNCHHYKNFIEHSKFCKEIPAQCEMCFNLLTLFAHHSLSCSNVNCVIKPSCSSTFTLNILLHHVGVRQ